MPGQEHDFSDYDPNAQVQRTPELMAQRSAARAAKRAAPAPAQAPSLNFDASKLSGTYADMYKNQQQQVERQNAQTLNTAQRASSQQAALKGYSPEMAAAYANRAMAGAYDSNREASQNLMDTELQLKKDQEADYLGQIEQIGRANPELAQKLYFQVKQGIDPGDLSQYFKDGTVADGHKDFAVMKQQDVDAKVASGQMSNAEVQEWANANGRAFANVKGDATSGYRGIRKAFKDGNLHSGNTIYFDGKPYIFESYENSNDRLDIDKIVLIDPSKEKWDPETQTGDPSSFRIITW